jgi:nicotinamide phosphoribosyltransferase
MKANAIKGEFDLDWTDIYKDPITDPSKASKSGRVAVININGTMMYVREDTLSIREKNLLEIYWDGRDPYIWGNYRNDEFSNVRERAKI